MMRQDPDIILVGEIRDHDTAEMAFRAAMTGHQVFSTLHTNSALGAFPRLLDIGIQPTIMAGNIIGVIAQRLVRVLCVHCKEAYAPSNDERRLLGSSAADTGYVYRLRQHQRQRGKQRESRIQIAVDTQANRMNIHDLKALRIPLAMLLAVLATAAGLIYYSNAVLAQARLELTGKQAQLREARLRLQTSGDQKAVIVRYLDDYRRLQQLGFIGEEQRINWLDGLRLSNQQLRLFGVDYEIGTQQPYPYASELNGKTTGAGSVRSDQITSRDSPRGREKAFDPPDEAMRANDENLK